MRDKMIERKAAAIQKDLEGWARTHNVLKPGEYLVFRVDVRQRAMVIHEEDDFLKMSVEDFFTKERLLELGVHRLLAERVKNAIRNGCGAYHKGDGLGWIWTCKSVHEFLLKYPRRRNLELIKNMGKKSADHFIIAMKKIGVEIPD